MRARGLDGVKATALDAGIPQSLMSNYLNGKIENPQRRNVKKLAAWAGVDEAVVWDLVPEEGRVAAVPAVPEAADRLRALEEEARALRRLVQGALVPPAGLSTARPGDRPRLLRQRPGARDWWHLLEHDDLDTPFAGPAIPLGSILWLDPRRTPLPADGEYPPDAVVVLVDGTAYARLVGDDGVTLVSRVPGAVSLRLDTPGLTVVGVVNHAQQGR